MFFKKYINFTYYLKITSLYGRVSCYLQIPVSLSYGCYIPNLVKIGPEVFEKNMLTQDAR